MRERYSVGDLVHIPQAVVLVDCENNIDEDPQLTIPLNLHETDKPEIGVVMHASEYGYLRVLVHGKPWTVKNDRVYNLREINSDQIHRDS
jgi:hypothetical protein